MKDRNGRQVGDDCLRAVAAAIQATVRSQAVATRYGGKETVILSKTDSAAASQIAENVRSVIEDVVVRFNAKTLEITYNGRNIAQVLDLRVEEALPFFEAESSVHHALSVLQEVGLGYLRLGQPATELSGGEAQRVKLATELQRANRGDVLYVLDEPTTGLHPSDVERLLKQLDGLVAGGNTVLTVEHDLHVIAASDWVIDIGPGAGDEGGRVVAEGTPEAVAGKIGSVTAPYLAAQLGVSAS